MTREQMKSHFIVHTNGQDEWIKVDKRTYDKAIDMFCDAHEAEIEDLRSTIKRIQTNLSYERDWFEELKKQLNAKDEENANLKARIAELEKEIKGVENDRDR